MQAIIGVVLAGGRSSRMGRDKALLHWQGKTLLQTKVEQLQRLLGSAVYVSGQYPGYQCIVDIDISRGPLSGIYSCLNQLESPAFLFVPVDMPLLSDVVLRQLLACFQQTNRSAYCQNSMFPLYVVRNQQTESILRSLLDEQDPKRASIVAFSSAIGANVIELPAEYQTVMVNTNTPDQWQAAQKTNGEHS
ncbi:MULTISPECIES: molybdenum cofactor guanylyltransferase [unclassified Agarivorans]|uniref:molybdenum cofactor guanylyltransferase n=1 Tax=unclassified Agarivorans TaxID=2636026 RepID=UPI003D7EE0D3